MKHELYKLLQKFAKFAIKKFPADSLLTGKILFQRNNRKGIFHIRKLYKKQQLVSGITKKRANESQFPPEQNNAWYFI